MKPEAKPPRLAILRWRLFTALAVLSLLLCIATLALWWLSHYRSDGRGSGGANFWATIKNHRGQVAFSLMLGRGQHGLFRSYSSSSNRPTDAHGLEQFLQRRANVYRRADGQASSYSFLGVGFHSLRVGTIGNDPPTVSRIVVVPHWFLALIFAILPAFYLRGMLRSRRRNRPGLCPVCGYDLRATSERCPECGTAVSP